MASIPSTIPAQVAWMVTFAAALTADPATYGISAPEAATIQSAVDAVEAAFDLYGSTNRNPNNPDERTPSGIATMYADLAVARTLCQSYVYIIRSNFGIPDGVKVAAGVQPLDTNRTPRPVADSPPLLSILRAEPGVHIVRFADSNSPDVRAKPLGARAIQLFAKIGTEASSDPTGAVYAGTFTSNGRSLPSLAPRVVYDPADAGKVSSIFGRWLGSRADVGPWSLPVSMTIAF